MDLNTIIQMVSSVGFPIVCVFVMFKLYREELIKMHEAIDNNTRVIQTLIDKLDGKGG